MIQFVTDFADQAVALPAIAALACVLAAQGWARGALAWLAATGGAFSAVLAAKLWFIACGSRDAGLGIYSPSGHVAAAALLGGGLAATLGARPGWAGAAGAAVGAAIGATRIALGAHTWPEALMGGALGAIGAVALSAIAGPPPAIRRWPALAAVAVVALAAHGTRLPAEASIRDASGWLASALDWCR